MHFGDSKVLTEFANSVKPSELPVLINNSSRFIAAFESFK